MKIFVLSKIEAYLNKENILREKIPLISIRDSNDPRALLSQYGDQPFILNLQFDDIESFEDIDPYGFRPDPSRNILFNEWLAEKIFAFAEQFKDSDMMVLHCVAGISRSGAVGKFMNFLMNTLNKNVEDDEFFSRQNAQIQPNNLVYTTLMKMYQQKEDLKNG